MGRGLKNEEQTKEEKEMTYQVTSKKNWCTTKSFETLEEAIAWCDKQKTKLGHRVSHYDRESRRVVKDYETFGK